MAFRPTVIGVRNYRRELASLSVVKELVFRVHRNVPVAPEPVWRGLFECLPAQLSGESLQKRKNPASSAGHRVDSNRLSTPTSTKCYPVFVRRLTIGSD